MSAKLRRDCPRDTYPKYPTLTEVSGVHGEFSMIIYLKLFTRLGYDRKALLETGTGYQNFQILIPFYITGTGN